ncbi:MAG: carboxypeptidase M32 [Asgard group archaeon]|nr:carboxypeptidase M32 [Asgard group archaeon]
MGNIPQYKKLLSIYKDNVMLGNVGSIVSWDYEVVMPKKATRQRADEMGLFSGFLHERVTSPEIGNLLNEIKTHKNFEELPDNGKRNVELIQRDYDKATKIPKEFAQEITKHGALATENWKKAKSKADFSIFRDDLAKMIELVKKKAHYFDSEKDPYDVLLDLYETGFSKAIYDKIFDEVKAGLVPIIKKIRDSPNQPDESLILRECPIELQRKVVHDSVKLVHYDLEGGRVDEAVHPFTNGYYDDVRITVHYNPKDFTAAFYGGMHEAGHGIYEQNLPQEFKYLPIGQSSSSAMHEGQARFIENIIGRSPEFWEYYLPKFKKLTGKVFADVELNPFVNAINRVQSSKIRIFADPVTYNMHIILRYEIEKDIFMDKITVDEIPEVWNSKIKEYLDIDIKNDTEGCLQDTHWAWEYFAYFPTYALGSYYNAQLVTTLTKDIPDWKDNMRQGKIKPIHDWLNKSIRHRAYLHDPLDLIKLVTGKDFSAEYFIKATNEKYSKIYGF